jgi:hypothetical protein
MLSESHAGFCDKVVEGAHSFRTNNKHGGRYLIGLCEGEAIAMDAVVMPASTAFKSRVGRDSAAAAGNFCSSGKKGRQPGNGRLVVTKFNGKAADAGCAWEHVKTVNIPPGAYFEDYSDIAFSGNQVAPFCTMHDP